MKKFTAIVLMIALVFLFVACDGSSDSYPVYGGVTGEGGGIRSYEKAYEGKLTGEYLDGAGKEEANGSQIRAGQLTAKAWNDNDNYDKWKELFFAGTDNDPAGKFAEFANNAWACDTSLRVKVTVKRGETPLSGVKVRYVDEAQKQWISRTDAQGVAYLFPNAKEGTVRVTDGESEQSLTFTQEHRDLVFDLESGKEKANLIKIMFVIDATGSMGDEMEYIAAELTDVVHRVAEQANGVKIDLALLFYRDDGDREKFAYHDFVNVTEEEGLKQQVKVLNAQRAEGGDDIPEAMDEALLMAAGKDWGEENSTNLMFLVLDAPPHEEGIHHINTMNALNAAAAKGIRLCPVLCSGADSFCEYVTRLGALLTGGTSVFVTDDSGIGGEHLDPDLPDATVEKLNDLLVRLVVGYHTGEFPEPVAWIPPQTSEEQTQGGKIVEGSVTEREMFAD